VQYNGIKSDAARVMLAFSSERNCRRQIEVQRRGAMKKAR